MQTTDAPGYHLELLTAACCMATQMLSYSPNDTGGDATELRVERFSQSKGTGSVSRITKSSLGSTSARCDSEMWPQRKDSSVTKVGIVTVRVISSYGENCI
jgi:hypothetical protein